MCAMCIVRHVRWSRHGESDIVVSCAVGESGVGGRKAGDGVSILYA